MKRRRYFGMGNTLMQIVQHSDDQLRKFKRIIGIERIDFQNGTVGNLFQFLRGFGLIPVKIGDSQQRGHRIEKTPGTRTQRRIDPTGYHAANQPDTVLSHSFHKIMRQRHILAIQRI